MYTLTRTGVLKSHVNAISSFVIFLRKPEYFTPYAGEDHNFEQ